MMGCPGLSRFYQGWALLGVYGHAEFRVKSNYHSGLEG
jgi:hypothetical protein